MVDRRTVVVSLGIALVFLGLVMIPIGIWRVRDGAAWNQFGDKLDQAIEAEVAKGRQMAPDQAKVRQFANTLREFGERSLIVQAWLFSLMPLITGAIMLMIGRRMSRIQKRFG